MTTARQKKRLRLFILLVIFTVILINCYAFHELIQVAGSIKVSILPGSVYNQLMQLAVILAVNSLVIIYLLVFRGGKGL